MMQGGKTWHILLTFVCLWAGGVSARVGLDTPKDIVATLVWSGGDLVYSTDICVISTQQPNQSGNTPVPYQVTTIAPTPFVLSNGASQIPFSAAWRDLAGSAVRTLSPGVPTGDIFTGLAFGCPPQAANARLTVTFPESALLVAPPGTYTAAFMIWVESSGQGRPRIRQTINFSLTIAGVVRISQLNDINLGTFDGISNLAASDSLCVFRNFPGAYGVRVSGQGTGGAFVVVNGTSQVPVAVTWNDGTGAAALMAGALLSGRANAYSADPDCAGGAANNAVLGVSVLAIDMQVADPGLHSGVLTVTVEVQ